MTNLHAPRHSGNPVSPAVSHAAAPEVANPVGAESAEPANLAVTLAAELRAAEAEAEDGIDLTSSAATVFACMLGASETGGGAAEAALRLADRYLVAAIHAPCGLGLSECADDVQRLVQGAVELLRRQRVGLEVERAEAAKRIATGDRAQKVATLAVEIAGAVGCPASEEHALLRHRIAVRELGIDATTAPLLGLVERELDRIGSTSSRKAVDAYRARSAASNKAFIDAEAALPVERRATTKTATTKRAKAVRA